MTPPKLPANVYTNIQPPPSTSAVNILLLDALNTLPADQVFMKQESIKYLKAMPRGTRIAVLGLGSSLRILQGFTSAHGYALPEGVAEAGVQPLEKVRAQIENILGDEDGRQAYDKWIAKLRNKAYILYNLDGS